MVAELLKGMQSFGLYREVSVTHDVSPLQVQGTLRSGERISFRYRWGLVSMGVSIGIREVAGYSFQVEQGVDVPEEECIFLLDQWSLHFALRGARLSVPAKEEVFERPPPGMALSWPRTGRRRYPSPAPEQEISSVENCAEPGRAFVSSCPGLFK